MNSNYEDPQSTLRHEPLPNFIFQYQPFLLRSLQFPSHGFCFLRRLEIQIWWERFLQNYVAKKPLKQRLDEENKQINTLTRRNYFEKTKVSNHEKEDWLTTKYYLNDMKQKHTKPISIKDQGNGMDKVSNQKRKYRYMIKYDSVLHDIISSNKYEK